MWHSCSSSCKLKQHHEPECSNGSDKQVHTRVCSPRHPCITSVDTRRGGGITLRLHCHAYTLLYMHASLKCVSSNESSARSTRQTQPSHHEQTGSHKCEVGPWMWTERGVGTPSDRLTEDLWTGNTCLPVEP